MQTYMKTKLNRNIFNKNFKQTLIEIKMKNKKNQNKIRLHCY